MKTNKNKLLLVIALTLISFLGKAQVGINKDNPDPSAILQVSDDARGVILPQISSDGSLTPSSGTKSDGLLYYNTVQHRFKYYNIERKWECVNPWNADDTTSITTNATVSINNSLAVTTVNATTVNAITGNGITPIGGIIMWSGDPNSVGTGKLAGWKLCNGVGAYNDINGVSQSIPNLTDRFIVGAGGSYNVGNTGGEATHTLTAAELPSHNHVGTTDRDGTHPHSVYGFAEVSNDWKGGGDSSPGNGTGKQVSRSTGGTDGSHNHRYTTTSFGGNGAHENRPPYYALAFIIRVQ